jgi:CheY-like chemotaxis protein
MSELSNKTILIVDDEIELCEMLAEEFASYNAKPFVANSAKQALEHIDTLQVFDLVLTDINMPNRNGIELVGDIQTRKKPLPACIFLSGYSSYQTKLLYSIGGHKLIAKPYDLADIIAHSIYAMMPIEQKLKTVPSSKSFKQILIETQIRLNNSSVLVLGNGGFAIKTENTIIQGDEQIEFAINIETEDAGAIFFKGVGVCRWKQSLSATSCLYGIEIIYLEPEVLQFFIAYNSKIKTPSYIPLL